MHLTPLSVSSMAHTKTSLQSTDLSKNTAVLPLRCLCFWGALVSPPHIITQHNTSPCFDSWVYEEPHPTLWKREAKRCEEIKRQEIKEKKRQLPNAINWGGGEQEMKKQQQQKYSKKLKKNAKKAEQATNSKM